MAKRGNRTVLIALIAIAGVLVVCVVAGIIGAIAGVGSKNATPNATASSADWAAAETSAGIPPKPDAATQAAYLADLAAIDPAIVGKHSADTMVDRGRNQCASMASTKDRAKLIESTNKRFTAPGHPDGFGAETAARILDVVHKRLCPTY